MATLKLHVDEPAGRDDPIPFPTTLARRAVASRPTGIAGRSWQSRPDSIRLAERALSRVEGDMGRLMELVGMDDDDRPRAA